MGKVEKATLEHRLEIVKQALLDFASFPSIGQLRERLQERCDVQVTDQSLQKWFSDFKQHVLEYYPYPFFKSLGLEFWIIYLYGFGAVEIGTRIPYRRWFSSGRIYGTEKKIVEVHVAIPPLLSPKIREYLNRQKEEGRLSSFDVHVGSESSCRFPAGESDPDEEYDYLCRQIRRQQSKPVAINKLIREEPLFLLYLLEGFGEADTPERIWCHTHYKLGRDLARYGVADPENDEEVIKTLRAVRDRLAEEDVAAELVAFTNIVVRPSGAERLPLVTFHLKDHRGADNRTQVSRAVFDVLRQHAAEFHMNPLDDSAFYVTIVFRQMEGISQMLAQLRGAGADVSDVHVHSHEWEKTSRKRIHYKIPYYDLYDPSSGIWKEDGVVPYEKQE